MSLNSIKPVLFGESAALNKMIDECKMAIAMRKPVIWIKTNEADIVRNIIDDNNLILNLRKRDNAGWDIPTQKEIDSTMTVWTKSSDSNIIRLSVSEKNECFTKFAEKQENPPHLFIIKNDSSGYSNEKNILWRDIFSFIDAYISDIDGNTALGRSAVIIFGEKVDIPYEYTPYCHIVDEEYPDRNEISEIVDNVLGSTYGKKEIIEIIKKNIIGFSLTQVRRLALYLRNNSFDINTAKRIIINERTQELKRCELLELEDVPNGIRVAGMVNFEEWMKEQETYLSNTEDMKEKTGASSPKGVLLCGIPGSGKSAAAKMFSDITGLPLLKMDIGKLMGGLVGDSEHNMERALKIADATAPCILLIDELDKGFEGAKANNNGGSNDTFRRMFATFLTWMQTHKKPCFVFATANDISMLPKEFFRSGRFDCMYSLYMPTYRECIDIFKYHINRRIGEKSKQGEYIGKLKPTYIFTAENAANTCMNYLGKKKRYVTGADIEKLVDVTLRRIYLKRDSDNSTISQEEWAKCFYDVVDGTTVYGDGKEQLDSIAMCYIKLLRNNFKPVAKDPIISNYTVTIKSDSNNKNGNDNNQTNYEHNKLPEFEVKYKAAVNDNAYDKNFYQTISELIDKYAPTYEDNALRKMI